MIYISWSTPSMDQFDQYLLPSRLLCRPVNFWKFHCRRLSESGSASLIATFSCFNVKSLPLFSWNCGYLYFQYLYSLLQQTAVRTICSLFVVYRFLTRWQYLVQWSHYTVNHDESVIGDSYTLSDDQLFSIDCQLVTSFTILHQLTHNVIIIVSSPTCT